MKDTTQNETGIEDDQKLEERKSDATSDKTLSELEESEPVTSGDSIQGEPGPSPDGAVDETDELKDAGPM